MSDDAPSIGDVLEVEWPCVSEDGGEIRRQWFTVSVAGVEPRSDTQRFPKFLLQFEDGEEVSHSLRKMSWKWKHKEATPTLAVAAGSGSTEAAVSTATLSRSTRMQQDHIDHSGFVHECWIDEELLSFCDEMHAQRDVIGDKTRGDSAYGEPLAGGLVSVVIRREALPPRERDLYHKLHQRCIQEIPLAWPGWLQKAAGRSARARPSQDLRLLQYSEGAKFKAHVDSGWACQALVYLN
eukprot:CAMPEP_0178370866 /NCGR_PEP_ID=MMETSP0689_2-20121128/528_1 /TAXON_ID=160604 /ORGANISM="Amphidinium massartii, Strain CS-259" /LENGTH=237 /DNA_ID=CAMNT_0019990711 /DNA_START=48 /DNA_END=758 /DNA_ORIENTATION=-